MLPFFSGELTERIKFASRTNALRNKFEIVRPLHLFDVDSGLCRKANEQCHQTPCVRETELKRRHIRRRNHERFASFVSCELPISRCDSKTTGQAQPQQSASNNVIMCILSVDEAARFFFLSQQLIAKRDRYPGRRFTGIRQEDQRLIFFQADRQASWPNESCHA